MNSFRRFAVFMCLGILYTQATKSQDASTTINQKESIFTGSGLKAEDIVIKSDAIFIGVITGMGISDLAASGQSIYRGFKIQVSQTLKGSVDVQITATITTIIQGRALENAPTTGNSYIFFVKKNAQAASDQFTVLKLLPATDANIAKVKALIAAAPAGK